MHPELEGPDPQHLVNAIAASSDDVIYAKDLHGRLVFANPAALALIGKPRDQVIGRTDADFLNDKQVADAVMANDRRVMQDGVAVEVEEIVPRPDGTEAVWASRKTPYRDGAGRVVGLLGISRDITDRKRIEREKEALGAQKQLALDAAGMGWWHYDPISRVATYDSRYCEIFGVEGSQRPNEEILRLIDPGDLPGVWRQVEAALDPVAPAPYHCQFRIRRGGRDLRWIEAHGLAVFELREGVRTATSFVGTVQDITGRKETEQALHKAQQLLQSTMDHFPTVIAFKDRAGRFIEVNIALERLLQRPRAAILGLTAFDLFDHATASAITATEQQVMASRSTAQVQRTRTIAGREWISLDTIFPLVNAAGEVYGVGYISHDLTAVTRAQEALSAANDELREAARQKDIFLATLAHELRNPLAPLRTISALLGQRAGDPLVGRVRGIIDRQVGHMVRLVDDLLDVSRITQGMVQLRLQEADLAALALEVVNAQQDLATQRGVSLRLHVEGAAPLVSADATRLCQCITNLVHNAIKFTPPAGHVDVHVMHTDTGALLRVRDTGSGVDPDNLERIFGLFVQEQASGMAGHSGLGIGLAITRKIVQLHGGTVTAASDGPGHGATFTLELPLLRLASPAAQAGAGAASAGDDAEADDLILVVDDNVDAATTLGDLLQMHGFQTITAFTGEEALRMASQHRPRLLLLDIGLPDVSGYDVCRRIRGDAACGEPTIVAVTGWGQDSDKARAMEAGFDAHLKKPVSPDDLLACVRRVCGGT